MRVAAGEESLTRSSALHGSPSCLACLCPTGRFIDETRMELLGSTEYPRHLGRFLSSAPAGSATRFERSRLRGPVCRRRHRARGGRCDMASAEPSRQALGALRIPWRTLSGHASPWAPSPAMLAAIAFAAIAAAAATLALGLANDEVDHVAIRVFLNDWITLNYIGAGLIAWWRRPDSRFGLLMIGAGFVNF